MTWLAVWNAPFDETAEFPTEIAAETWAVKKSGEIGEPVAVCEIPDLDPTQTKEHP